MATTTPNFGWPVPTSTDLVKDGATAIEALGDAIDASLVDLEGGTTGQILAKASNTDMDFAWITNDVGDITAVTAGTGISGGGTSGAVTITNSMATEITAKGDLIVGTGSATFDNLAAGANNLVLTAASGETTGLKYSPDWTSYTPTWSSTGVSPSLGNGTLSGKYLQIGKSVIVQVYFKVGSTTTTGTGVWFFSLPINAYESVVTTGGIPGSAYIEDAAVAGYQALAARKASGGDKFSLLTATNAEVGQTTPFTWATNDFFYSQLSYGVA